MHSARIEKEADLNVCGLNVEGQPSGSAGGLVTALSPDYHTKYMMMEKYTSSDGIKREGILALI